MRCEGNAKGRRSVFGAETNAKNQWDEVAVQ